VGYLQQDIYLTSWIGVAGSVMTLLVVVPPWPAFNQHPELWLGSGKGGMLQSGIVVAGKKVQ
jgi:signal peptidase complex subunit 1